MKSISMWACATVALVLFAGQASAAKTLAAGKIKSINSDKKQFVLTDSARKDFTFKLADDVVVNRGGKEGKSDLKVDDEVNVCYDKGLVNWTVHYILVQEGGTKNSFLVLGTVKGYDGDKKELSVTDSEGKARTMTVSGAKVRLNKEDSKIENVKIGDHVLLIMETKGDKSTVKSVIVERK